MSTGDARTDIMRSIRTHLATSVPYDTYLPFSRKALSNGSPASLTDEFKRNLELVDGQCLIVQSDAEIEEAVQRITEGKRIALSSVTFSKQDLFAVDVGITRAQAGIAETGTLVLDSSVERNRLVSLVPPIHIAILDASNIFFTLGDTLAALHSGPELSPAITFITGPSRTADIELTLALGVHGPQQLYVIINEGVAGLNKTVIAEKET